MPKSLLCFCAQFACIYLFHAMRYSKLREKLRVFLRRVNIGVRIKGDERLPGSSDFVQRVLTQVEEQLEEKFRLQVSVISLPTLINKVAHCYNIDVEILKSTSKERPVTEARRVLCYIAVRKLGYKCTEASKAMGISAVTVSKAVSLGRELPDINKIHKQMLDN